MSYNVAVRAGNMVFCDFFFFTCKFRKVFLYCVLYVRWIYFEEGSLVKDFYFIIDDEFKVNCLY